MLSVYIPPLVAVCGKKMVFAKCGYAGGAWHGGRIMFGLSVPYQ